MNEAPNNPRFSSNSRIFGKTEWGALIFSFVLIAFFAIPNFLEARHELQSDECVRRLTLMADCLKYLAIQNNTQPGEKVCELFDLNTIILAHQRGAFVELVGESEQTLYYQVGAEPDCPNLNGEHVFSLFLDENGDIVPPRCTLCAEDDEYAIERGWCVADMSQVDGILSFQDVEDDGTE